MLNRNVKQNRQYRDQLRLFQSNGVSELWAILVSSYSLILVLYELCNYMLQVLDIDCRFLLDQTFPATSIQPSLQLSDLILQGLNKHRE